MKKKKKKKNNNNNNNYTVYYIWAYGITSYPMSISTRWSPVQTQLITPPWPPPPPLPVLFNNSYHCPPLPTQSIQTSFHRAAWPVWMACQQGRRQGKLISGNRDYQIFSRPHPPPPHPRRHPSPLRAPTCLDLFGYVAMATARGETQKSESNLGGLWFVFFCISPDGVCLNGRRTLNIDPGVGRCSCMVYD